MKKPVLIIIFFLLMFPGNLWSQQVRLFKEIGNQGIKGMPSTSEMN